MIPLIHKFCETQRLRHSFWYLIYWRYVLLKIITGSCDSDRFVTTSEMKESSPISMPHVTFSLSSLISAVRSWYDFSCLVELTSMSASTTFGCALTTATIYGHHRILSLVLKNRAIIDGHAHRHGTALHVAACMGNKPMVELPFRRRANINARAGMHGTAFFSSSLRSR
jgi:hypothetical protein